MSPDAFRPPENELSSHPRPRRQSDAALPRTVLWRVKSNQYKNAFISSGGATPLVDVGDIRREAVGGRRRRRRLVPPLFISSVL
ncbi:hypothetical protein EVAR_34609_1 [Eumeta japonica]|uniref:Uncharacterized protein n=1 Tax=Eumeta variegata TaxID=151549 RepID=A0A4C1VI38_EUMVA|nr:hypothetical protein EVAR_34609_1 [Eumeta japonica]